MTLIAVISNFIILFTILRIIQLYTNRGEYENNKKYLRVYPGRRELFEGIIFDMCCDCFRFCQPFWSYYIYAGDEQSFGHDKKN